MTRTQQPWSVGETCLSEEEALVWPLQPKRMIDREEIRLARILIIDDEPSVAGLLERYLRKGGYQHVRCTHRPEQAAQIYQDYRPDLVILDLSMPGCDGFQVMANLRLVELDFSYLPILVLSGELAREVRIRALEAGARDFLSKPFDDEVLTRVHNLLEVRLLYQRARSENQRLEEAVDQRTAQLQEAQLETVRRLALAADFRDDDTGAHITRIGRYCLVLAEAAQISGEEMALLQQAAPMHDMGKLGIADAILLKPGRLTAEEFEVMKSHTTIGASILSGSSSPLLQMAEVIARSHHERWDGSGYPEGRRGEEIPLMARIVAVADVFDALTSRRPYKEPWPDQKAIDEIKRGAGSHFDPRIVECFGQCLPQITAIRAQLNPHAESAPLA